jgi:effector-binding domain-containing protein
MKGFLRTVVLTLATVALALGGGLLLPRKVAVERSIEIAAPQATVFEYVNSMKTAQVWSPWRARDPKADYRISGPLVGVGSRLDWDGPKSGKGVQRIIASTPYGHVRQAVDFGDGSDNQITYSFVPTAKGTRVVWHMDTDLGMNPVGRYFGLFLDQMVGPDFERGLASLRAVAEAAPRVEMAPFHPTLIEVRSQMIAYVSGSTPLESAAISRSLTQAFRDCAGFLAAKGLKGVGHPLSIGVSVDRAKGLYEFEAGLPFIGSVPAEPSQTVRIKQTYAGLAVQAVYHGPYEQMGPAYQAMDLYMTLHHLEQVGPAWEEYVSDPGVTPEDQLETQIYFPVRSIETK